MDRSRFLIAKYVPDVFRNEPRNIGVVLWSPDGVAARFAGERADAPGEVDEAHVPPFVSSAEAYEQWVRYWRREMAKPVIRPATGGPATARSSPDWLNAFRQVGPSNFILADGGVLLEPVPVRELARAVDALFESYVATDERSAPLALEPPPRRSAVSASLPAVLSEAVRAERDPETN